MLVVILIIIVLMTWPKGYGHSEICGLVPPTGVLGLDKPNHSTGDLEIQVSSVGRWVINHLKRVE